MLKLRNVIMVLGALLAAGFFMFGNVYVEGGRFGMTGYSGKLLMDRYFNHFTGISSQRDLFFVSMAVVPCLIFILNVGDVLGIVKNKVYKLCSYILISLTIIGLFYPYGTVSSNDITSLMGVNAPLCIYAFMLVFLVFTKDTPLRLVRSN